MDMLRSNSKSLGNPYSRSWRRKGKAAVWDGFAEKESFKPGMKEWVGDGKLIIIISMTASLYTEGRIRSLRMTLLLLIRDAY